MGTLAHASHSITMLEPSAGRAAGPPPTILLVDDDEPLRPLIRLALETHGFHVIEASNGEQALAACAHHEGSIALLLVDMVLRCTTGFDLAQRLLRLRPEMKVLYISGYPRRYFPHIEPLGPAYGFLQKPFTPAFLSQRVLELLQASGR